MPSVTATEGDRNRIATHDDLVAACVAEAEALGVSVEVRQTDDEAVYLAWLHEAADGSADALILNPAAWTHTSVAVRDASGRAVAVRKRAVTRDSATIQGGSVWVMASLRVIRGMHVAPHIVALPAATLIAPRHEKPSPRGGRHTARRATIPASRPQVAQLGTRIKNVHLKEFTKKGTDYSLESFRPLLDGTTNWPAVLEAFDQTDYRGYLTFEYFHPYPHFPEALVYQTADSLDRMLGIK